jgi:uncharacterized membrane protein YhfC
MQNIDLVYLIQPIIIIVLSVVLILYWHFRRSFRGIVLVYSLVAYAVAIALKYAVQIPTISSVESYFGADSVGLGVYYGLQTVFFEVGLAYLIAWYATSRGKLSKTDAESYGIGLGFWENAVLIGAFSLIDLVAYYFVLSTNTPIAQTLFNQLSVSSPGLFSPPLKALGDVAAGTIERISSILIHFAWGYLCVMAAFFNKKRYLLLALPMGFVDFLFPFAPNLGLIGFEALVFVLSAASLAIAWYATREVRKNK